MRFTSGLQEGPAARRDHLDRFIEPELVWAGRLRKTEPLAFAAAENPPFPREAEMSGEDKKKIDILSDQVSERVRELTSEEVENVSGGEGFNC